MLIDKDLKDKLNHALNEAILLGVEFDENDNSVSCTFSPVAINKEGNVPEDNRLLFIFKPVGHFVASLRNGDWNNNNASIEIFEPIDILEKIQSFRGQPIYGWDFINCDEKDFDNWKDCLSFDLWTSDSIGLTNTIDLFQEGFERHIDLRIWFDNFEISTLNYENVEIVDFIDNGFRGWDSIYKSDDKASNFGIIPLTEENRQKIKDSFDKLNEE